MVEWLWHPTSETRLGSPPVPVSRVMLSMLVRDPAGVELVYFGDRMWPAIGDGDRVTVRAPDDLEEGAIVAVWCDGRLELLRIVSAHGEACEVAGDSDPGEPVRIGRGDVAGRVDRPAEVVSKRSRSLRRLRLDFAETGVGFRDEAVDGGEGEESERAGREGATPDVLDPGISRDGTRERPGGPHAHRDADHGSCGSGSVRRKYDHQAAQYDGRGAGTLSASVMGALASRLQSGGTVLVVGSGTGPECFQLADAGYRPRGIDFSPAMTAIARRAAAERPDEISFTQADITRHEEPRGSLDAVFFSFSVYSFLRPRGARVRTLRRMADWVRPGGTLWLSATRADDAYRRAMLRVRRFRQGGELGDSHSRWHGADGTVQRSFVHVFSTARLVAEARQGGWRVAQELDSHLVLLRA